MTLVAETFPNGASVCCGTTLSAVATEGSCLSSAKVAI
jgi:hypothetical protein